MIVEFVGGGSGGEGRRFVQGVGIQVVTELSAFQLQRSVFQYVFLCTENDEVASTVEKGFLLPSLPPPFLLFLLVVCFCSSLINLHSFPSFPPPLTFPLTPRLLLPSILSHQAFLSANILERNNSCSFTSAPLSTLMSPHDASSSLRGRFSLPRDRSPV